MGVQSSPALRSVTDRGDLGSGYDRNALLVFLKLKEHTAACNLDRTARVVPKTL